MVPLWLYVRKRHFLCFNRNLILQIEKNHYGEKFKIREVSNYLFGRLYKKRIFKMNNNKKILKFYALTLFIASVKSSINEQNMQIKNTLLVIVRKFDTVSIGF
ncbi:unnamed protein product [Paramecium octaurelia]|uniref:Uncharacterized protein n=1 Tax=Paramecium octaurelia TaxID=43137 RepID=A0A8S1WIL7_PAROT|nr:unnamed protein product [Paramecium octaurelia]